MGYSEPMTQAELLTRSERLAGGLLGLLIGDALGVPYEFHPPETLPPTTAIDFRPPPGFRRAHPGVPPGTWSDDGAQALVLLDSLLACQGLDLTHFATGLRRWLSEGFCAVGGMLFDIGTQTSTAINRLNAGVPPERSGPAGESQNGNGALMRVLPLALWHRGPDAELVQLAMRQALPTHGHIRSQLACALYCLWARALLQGQWDGWTWAEARLKEMAEPLSLPSNELAYLLDPARAGEARGSGYVLDTLWSARQVLTDSSAYADCVRAAVALGHDTDTTAAVAGGLAGIRYGLGSIPVAWREGLRGQLIYQPRLEALLAHARE